MEERKSRLNWLARVSIITTARSSSYDWSPSSFTTSNQWRNRRYLHRYNGYQVVDGFEAEQDYYNFERMNLPESTSPSSWYAGYFHITEEILSVPAIVSSSGACYDAYDFSKGPLKMISPGRVSSIAIRTMRPIVTNSTNRRLGSWENILWLIFKERFSWIVQNVCEEINLFASIHFPFTEPSVEVDVFASSVVEKAVMYVRNRLTEITIRYGSPTCPENEWYWCDCILWLCSLVLDKSV